MEYKKLLKEVVFYDFIIGVIFSLILYIFLKEQGLIFLLGIGISYINLFINSYTLKIFIHVNDTLRVIIMIFSYLIRIFLVCSIGVLLFMINEFLIFLFIGGYTAQILSISICGIKAKQEGVWCNGGG